jgi:hypothetical protein
MRASEPLVLCAEALEKISKGGQEIREIATDGVLMASASLTS